MPIYMFVRFLGQSAISISLSAASIACLVPLLFGQSPSWLTAAIPFMFTYVVYNFDRLVDVDMVANPERSKALRRNRAWLGATMVLCLLGTVGLSLAQGFRIFAFVMAFPLASAAYVLPLLPFGKIRRFKDVPGLKAFYVAGVWCLLVPLAIELTGSRWSNGPFLFILAFLYLRIFIGASIGDLRDVKADVAAGVMTLVGLLGERRSHKLLDFLNAVSILVLVVATSTGWAPPAVLALIPSCLLSVTVQLAFRRFPSHRELLCDVIDIEYLSFFPLVLLVLRFLDH